MLKIKVFDLLIRITLTVTTMFILLILSDYGGWRGGLLGFINIIAMALYFGEDKE